MNYVRYVAFFKSKETWYLNGYLHNLGLGRNNGIEGSQFGAVRFGRNDGIEGYQFGAVRVGRNDGIEGYPFSLDCIHFGLNVV